MASVARRQSGARRGKGGQRTVGQQVATFAGYLATAFLIAMLVGVGYGFILLRSTIKTLPDTDSLADFMPGGATEIYATDKDPATGTNVVLGRIFTQYKEYAPITDIPHSVQDATVAIEDERFYSHRGVDLRGIGRALFRDLRGKRMGEGGSTLTQQLARNVFLSQKKNFRRKIQEAILAIQLEKSYSKEQILQMYLNEVCYGANTYGVRAASKMYFGKEPKALTIAESALLAGLPQSPTRFNPFDHLDNAVTRRNTVLFKMREQDYISEEQYAKATAEAPKLIPELKARQVDFKAPYFTTYVLRQLIKRYTSDVVYHGGLKVYTTLNYQMQVEAERAVENGVMDGQGSGVTEGALVSIEPHTGYIRAMVGGVDFKKHQFNNVTQGKDGRQPGSSFKVFVYTAAFISNPDKYTPDFEVLDEPVTFGKGKGAYTPHDDYGKYHGDVTIREALTHSYNVPAVKVANMIGIQHVVDLAHSMGIRTKLSPDLSLALGSNGVHPLDMCSAYSVFPNKGSRAEPMSIWKVEDSDGNVLEDNAPQVTQGIVPGRVVDEMSSMLRDVVLHGTAAGAKGIQDVEDARGKTGTTNDSKDVWFVGYTPELTTAVWCCGVKYVQKHGHVLPVYAPMPGLVGGTVCAPIWARFMKAAVAIQRQAALPEQTTPAKTVAEQNAAVAKVLKAVSGDAAADSGESEKPAPAASSRTPKPAPFDDTAAASPAPDDSPTPADKVGDPSSTPTPAAAPPASDTNLVPAAAPPVSRAVLKPVLPIDDTVTVSICEDSGLRATRWCPVTVERSFPRGQAPAKYCNKHHAPPGDG